MKAQTSSIGHLIQSHLRRWKELTELSPQSTFWNCNLPLHPLFSSGDGVGAQISKDLAKGYKSRCGWVPRPKTALPNRARRARHPHRSSAKAPTWVYFPFCWLGSCRPRTGPGGAGVAHRRQLAAGGPSSQNMDSIPHLNCGMRLECLGGGWGACVTAG